MSIHYLGPINKLEECDRVQQKYPYNGRGGWEGMRTVVDSHLTKLNDPVYALIQPLTGETLSYHVHPWGYPLVSLDEELDGFEQPTMEGIG